jgi:hypothetical protein
VTDNRQDKLTITAAPYGPKREKACYCLDSRLSVFHLGYMVGRGRLELPTNGLKVRCSTN